MGTNFYSYCENNVVIYFDSTGYAKTYVIYYNNPGSGFYNQVMNSPYFNIKSKKVKLISVISNQNFINAWSFILKVKVLVFLGRIGKKKTNTLKLLKMRKNNYMIYYKIMVLFFLVYS